MESGCSRSDSAPATGHGGRQGTQEERDQLRVERRHRRRLDRARLQPRRHARFRRRRRRGLPVARRPAGWRSSRCCCVATAYLYMNRADPDCGTTFAWVDQGDGPAGRLDRRLGDHRRRHHRDGEPGADRGPLHVPALRLGAADSTFAVTAVGVAWIAIMTCDLLRSASSSPRARSVPARRRGHHARAVRGGRAVQGLRGQRRHTSVDPSLALVLPVRDRLHRALIAGVLLAGVHLLGLGQRGDRKRGDRGLDRGAGQVGGRRRP